MDEICQLRAELLRLLSIQKGGGPAVHGLGVLHCLVLDHDMEEELPGAPVVVAGGEKIPGGVPIPGKGRLGGLLQGLAPALGVRPHAGAGPEAEGENPRQDQNRRQKPQAAPHGVPSFPRQKTPPSGV